MGEHKHFASENKGDRKKQNKIIQTKTNKKKTSALLDLLKVNATRCETASQSHMLDRTGSSNILQFFDAVKSVQVGKSH